MSEQQQYYNLEENSKYCMSISRPKSIEDLDDNFMCEDEIQEINSDQVYLPSIGSTRTIIKHAAIKAELAVWVDKLIASKKRSILITDQELLDTLERGEAWNVPSYTDDKFTRHGERLRYRVKRKKTRATRGDLNQTWWIMLEAFDKKFSVRLPHHPMYIRRLELFLVYKKLIGWRAFCKAQETHWYGYGKERGIKEQRKFHRYIWDNPEEFMK